MEDQILNEILKDTYTIDSFKKRFQALRMKLSGEIYGGGKESRLGRPESEEPDESKEPEESEVKAQKKDAQSPSTHLTQAAGLDSSDSKPDDWLASFDQSLLKGLTSDQFSAMSEHVDKYISALNSLTIYFVFQPDNPQIKDIGEWLRKSLNNPKLIFNVKVDPSLIGGCAVVYKGVYKDYSMRAKIAKDKGQLIEEFRKYFKQ